MQPFNNAATKDFFCKELSKDTLFMLLKSTANNNKRNKNIKKRKLHLQWNKEKVQPQAAKHIHQTLQNLDRNEEEG